MLGVSASPLWSWADEKFLNCALLVVLSPMVGSIQVPVSELIALRYVAISPYHGRTRRTFWHIRVGEGASDATKRKTEL
jgi:hypothetical protein